jgi:hypothetical protein
VGGLTTVVLVVTGTRPVLDRDTVVVLVLDTVVVLVVGIVLVLTTVVVLVLDTVVVLVVGIVLVLTTVVVQRAALLVKVLRGSDRELDVNVPIRLVFVVLAVVDIYRISTCSPTNQG